VLGVAILHRKACATTGEIDALPGHQTKRTQQFESQKDVSSRPTLVVILPKKLRLPYHFAAKDIAKRSFDFFCKYIM
jgi:hypothetical protein